MPIFMYITCFFFLLSHRCSFHFWFIIEIALPYQYHKKKMHMFSSLANRTEQSREHHLTIPNKSTEFIVSESISITVIGLTKYEPFFTLFKFRYFLLKRRIEFVSVARRKIATHNVSLMALEFNFEQIVSVLFEFCFLFAHIHFETFGEKDLIGVLLSIALVNVVVFFRNTAPFN